MIYALHGFLGLPSDWSSLLEGFSYKAVRLIPEKKGLWRWGKQFNQNVSENDPNILMGYSMGGRLAMHALLDNPLLWKAVIIISAHPGLITKEAKQARLLQDMQWVHRFNNESWNTLMTSWNAQPVFTGESLNRKETDYNRQDLSDFLSFFSLSQQDNLKAELESIDCPIYWLAGENDFRYREIAESMSFKNPLSRVLIAEGCSHRVPWQSPDLFRQVCQEVDCQV